MKRLALSGVEVAIKTLGLVAALATLGAPTFAAEPRTLEVSVTKLSHGDVVRYVTLPGTIKANQGATLYAKVAGYLQRVTVDVGDRVKAGQVLAEIEVPELLADLEKYQAEARVAETDFTRISAAQRDAPDLIVPQQVDEARGRLDIAKAALVRTERLLAFSKIVAPFSGIITARFVDAGAFIPAATSGSTAQNAALLTIMDFDVVRAMVPVPEVDASFVRSGQPVQITVEGIAGKRFSTKVTRFSYALDDATRTMHVEADIPNKDGDLRPGMYATVKVGVEQHSGSSLMSTAALVMEKTNAFAYLANGDKAKKTALKIGFNDGDRVEVLEGIAPNDSIILAGKLPLSDGAPIKVTDAR
jgi:RND family efflux transporter MFP subunit